MEISPFIRELFLNPKYSRFKQRDLREQINTLDAEINIFKVNSLQLNELIVELTIKYPELKGEYTKIIGWFKKVKQNLRQKRVNAALEKNKKYNERKNDTDRKSRFLSNGKIDIERELE